MQAPKIPPPTPEEYAQRHQHDLATLLLCENCAMDPTIMAVLVETDQHAAVPAP